MLRRWHSMVPLTWLKQRASVMRPTAYQNSKVWEKFVSREDGFSVTVSIEHAFVTKPSMLLENWSITTVCRESTQVQETRKKSKPFGTTNDNTVIDPALDVQVTLQYGRYCIEIKINSLQFEHTVSWAIIGPGLDRNVTPLSEGKTNSSSTSASSPTVPPATVATNELSILIF